MLYALFGGQIETAEYLLSRGADINVIAQEGYTFWRMYDEILKSEVLTRALVESQVDINQGDESGMTPLMLATMLSHLDAIRFMLEHGADPTIRDSRDRTAMEYIQKGKNEAELRKLLNEAEAKWIAEHGEADEERTP